MFHRIIQRQNVLPFFKVRWRFSTWGIQKMSPERPSQLLTTASFVPLHVWKTTEGSSLSPRIGNLRNHSPLSDFQTILSQGEVKEEIECTYSFVIIKKKKQGAFSLWHIVCSVWVKYIEQYSFYCGLTQLTSIQFYCFKWETLKHSGSRCSSIIHHYTEYKLSGP